MDQQPGGLRVGDRVRVGGVDAVLTVVEVYDPAFGAFYRCSWADADGVVRVGVFGADRLAPADE